MLLLKTNPYHHFYMNFYIENDEICIETLLEPSLVSQMYGKKTFKSSYKDHISDVDHLTSIEYIGPMMILIKELFPDNYYNADKWIEKCESNSRYYNFYDIRRRYVRHNKINCYQYILNNNNINEYGKQILNTKILKNKSLDGLKRTINKYEQYLELKEQFTV